MTVTSRLLDPPVSTTLVNQPCAQGNTGEFQMHWLALLDHSNCTVYCPTFLVFQAQMSPISPLESSYQPWPGIGSVMASHNSCELVDVSASNGCKPPVQPAHPGYGMTA